MGATPNHPEIPAERVEMTITPGKGSDYTKQVPAEFALSSCLQVAKAMSEHTIRLRAAWQAELTGEAGPVRVRLDLPTIWTTNGRWPRLLSRSFRLARFDSRAEELLLRLEQCAGVRSVRIDGVVTSPWETGQRDGQIRLSDLNEGRHLIELELEPEGLGLASSGPVERPWGQLSLVFRPREGG